MAYHWTRHKSTTLLDLENSLMTQMYYLLTLLIWINIYQALVDSTLQYEYWINLVFRLCVWRIQEKV